MKLLTPEFGLLIWTLLAFLIVFFILKKMAWPAIIKGLRDRENSISESLATAERVKAEMAQLKSENEALLAKAREERAMMLKEARETKDKIINEAKEQAKTEANKIITEQKHLVEEKQHEILDSIKYARKIQQSLLPTDKYIERNLKNRS